VAVIGAERTTSNVSVARSVDGVESTASGAADVMRRCEEEFGEANVYSTITEVIERHAEQLTRQLTGA
jgi:hypothetical protein